ncbi:hypothetical protein [Sphingobium sp. B2]|uniref:hypothetical protein n=1 Tax=Sphingobium sp. B2 TaxID=2583228 RepID=UPI0011A02858|nr:hypothetical protein [Sphingobium sp. B2]
MIDDGRIDRRTALLLALSVPAATVATASAGGAADPLWALAGHALNSLGSAGAKALYDRNRTRLGALREGGSALAQSSAADFRMGRTLTIGGILVSEAEAAAALDLLHREGRFS